MFLFKLVDIYSIHGYKYTIDIILHPTICNFPHCYLVIIRSLYDSIIHYQLNSLQFTYNFASVRCFC